ncbi:hypothetical protein PG996_008311 [Apiospora saccharicola]|uniref:Uncharacterized protein n=1 Tax=Apiospora saccharicola TaxID=335842 RepID=A0ABR1UXJ6_9PEZI
MHFQSLISLSMGLLAAVSATNPNLGCKDCLGYSPDQIKYQCLQLCSKAFPAASSELQTCDQYCGDFVVDHKCCSGTCSSNANTCMNTFFPPAEVLTKTSTMAFEAGGRIHPRDLAVIAPSSPTTSSPRSVSVPMRQDGVFLLHPRVDYGEACCKAANVVLTSAAKPVLGLINGQQWDEDAASGVILVGFGLASAFACSRIFHVNCVFEAAGVAGQVAGGALPNRDEL